ncbi:hypothetical protein BSU00_01435 [Tenacibaculum sp. SG-28]|nr:hypothetical protein [Tenacibaculum sp. SG-28]PQJ22966.1 hypothetical protein BSU00_01435 [Tenacibaculum sp. SG-28]
MILITKHIIPKGFVGLAIYPFIFLKRKELKNNLYLINHEKIHLQQQRETLLLLFYLIYGIEWLIKLLLYKNTALAYVNISFEREAYTNENNLNYLETRKSWSFIRYI